eukprot:983125-Prymnesium_polylepis.1
MKRAVSRGTWSRRYGFIFESSITRGRNTQDVHSRTCTDVLGTLAPRPTDHAPSPRAKPTRTSPCAASALRHARAVVE